MALSLLLQAPSEGRSSPGAHRSRWMFAPDLPTTLRESQLAIAGCVLPSARGGAQQQYQEATQAAGQQADDAEVATIERIPSGWQLTRHGACVKIAVRRAFGGHEVQLPMLGSTALLCHGDEVRFSPSGTEGSSSGDGGISLARLQVELPVSGECDEYSSSGDEGEELGVAGDSIGAQDGAAANEQLSDADDGALTTSCAGPRRRSPN